VPKRELSELYYRSRDEDRSFRLQAFYNFANASIYLLDDWRPTELYDQSVLIHELVHHLQQKNGVKMRCPAALEQQAYDLQITWLREQGVEDPHLIMGANALAIHIVSECREDWSELFRR